MEKYAFLEFSTDIPKETLKCFVSKKKHKMKRTENIPRCKIKDSQTNVTDEALYIKSECIFVNAMVHLYICQE